MATKFPETNLQDVVTRLRAEMAQNLEALKKVARVVNSDPEFSGLSLIGGVKAILRRYHEVQEENRKLDAELKRLTFKR